MAKWWRTLGVCNSRPLKVLGVCSHVPLFTSCSGPNRSGFAGFFQLGTLLSSTGGEFGTDCGNNRKTSSCVSFWFFSLEQHYCSLKSQNTSSLVLLRVQMVPVIWPEFPVDVRLNWAQTAKIILHFISWTGFSLPYVWSSLWAASRPLTSCIPLLLAICCLARPSWSEAKCELAQHMCEHAVTSLLFFFFQSLKLAGVVNNAQVSVPIRILVFSFHNLYAAPAIEWIYWVFFFF